MKKATTILLVGLLLMAFAGTAMAETQTPAPQVPVPNQDFYQQMWNFCHGPNGMMNGYFGGYNGVAPQGFYGGMMGGNGYGSMMGGYGYGGMMGW